MKVFFDTEFTGLKDKNGVEIYEGDVVKVGKKMRGHNKPDEYIQDAMDFLYNNNPNLDQDALKPKQGKES